MTLHENRSSPHIIYVFIQYSPSVFAFLLFLWRWGELEQMNGISVHFDVGKQISEMSEQIEFVIQATTLCD